MNALELFLKSQKNCKVLDAGIPYEKYVPIDLSVNNLDLTSELINVSGTFDDYVFDHIRENNGYVAFGGYNEKRNLYQRSDLFTEERSIHIGLDLWADEETPVLAALDGTIHSFDFNTGSGNYGPTIILEHSYENGKFYTLYGHLSIESIEQIEIGDVFRKGQQIGTLGDPSVNGDYPPHLHFQIIDAIEDHFGDYPGVCSTEDIDYYLANCPDPNLLLNITAQS